MTEPPLNQVIAGKLRDAANLLEQQNANPFRVNAYRRAADTVDRLDRDVARLVEDEGSERLLELPGVGRGIAAAIIELVATGRWGQLERLRGTLDPVKLFQTVPGLGPELAQRIHDSLHVDSLESLETAAHDGSLESVAGLGPRRCAAIRAELAGILGRVRGRRSAHPTEGPSIELILQVDDEYRTAADADKLPTIAPRRFNPEGRAWLPILHTVHEPWHFTAMFSNTPRAHELERTHDWVVVYFYDVHHREGQHTVVTETRGPLMGRRVVRGREAECRQLALKNSGRQSTG